MDSDGVIPFIDDKAVLDDQWMVELLEAHKRHGAIATRGKLYLIGSRKPSFVPKEFHFLVGVTHKWIGETTQDARKTIGSNLYMGRDIFLYSGGFDPKIGWIVTRFQPSRLKDFIVRFRFIALIQLVMLKVLIVTAGVGYFYDLNRW